MKAKNLRLFRPCEGPAKQTLIVPSNGLGLKECITSREPSAWVFGTAFRVDPYWPSSD